MRRRRGRGHLSDLFYNTGDFTERSVDDTFGFTRQFSETMNQEMLEEERIRMKHEKEEEQRKEQNYPHCDLKDKPAGYNPGNKF